MKPLQIFYDENTKIWSGAPVPRYYGENCSIGRILFEEMRRKPKQICQISDTDQTQLTNEEVLRHAIRIAKYFQNLHLKQSDIVGLAADNTTYVVSVVLACFFSGIAYHGINPLQDEKTFKHLYNITKPKVIFCDSAQYGKIKSATSELGVKIVTLEQRVDNVAMVLDLLAPYVGEENFEPAILENGRDQTLAILCSSGSTGMPKAITVSNTTLLYQYASYLTSEDVIFMTSSLDWLSGLLLLLPSIIYGATRIISDKPYSPEYFLQIVERYRVTLALIPSFHIAMLVDCPETTANKLSTIKYMPTGGSICYPKTLCKMQSLLNNGVTILCYGSSEFGQLVTANTEVTVKSNSVGRILPGYKLKIIDKNGQNLGPGELGEICCSHGENWLGYYGNDEATAAVFDKERWLHTGDMGYIDNDMDLYVIDRVNDILKYRGMEYCPSEIERLVLELPGIKAICVFGVWNELDGDVAAALVVKTEESTLLEKDIVSYVASKTTATYKNLHAGIGFVEDLPTLFNGKIYRKGAKELYARLQSNAVH